MDIVTYALCRKLCASIAGGIKSMRVEGLTLYIETLDNQTLEIHFPTPKDGVSITDVNINQNHHLICIMSDGNTVDAGEVPYYIPQKGVDYYTQADKEELVQEVTEELSDSLTLTII